MQHETLKPVRNQGYVRKQVIAEGPMFNSFNYLVFITIYLVS